ncbi:MAG: SPFH domain-containing protein [Thermodesulfobacteriota bacterium]|nr:MAG: SPFH domain-containing protein [Thermodesulfobacteriota bacterium]
MGTNNVIFLEVLEWFDQMGTEVSHRLPEIGSGEFKLGAQVIVRDNQAAVFYSSGVACDAIGPGRHTLSTMNIPLLTKLLSLPWAFTSPIRAEVYFVNLKVFNNLKWGTRDPVAFRDKEFGLVRLRAHGICNIQVSQPVLFVNTLVGTQASYGIDDLENYLSEVIVSRLNDHLGEHLETLPDLPSRYEELAGGLSERLTKDLGHYGLALRDLYLNAITPPAEVQQAIDDRSRLGILEKDLQGLTQMKAAMALEKAAEGEGLAQGGIGMGLGLMIPGLLAGLQTGPGVAQPRDAVQEYCPECGLSVDAKARFCPHCGHQLLVLRQCGICGKNLSPKAKFCPACGAPAGQTHAPKICKECGSKNRPEAVYCNQCGRELKG